MWRKPVTSRGGVILALPPQKIYKQMARGVAGVIPALNPQTI